MSTPHFGLPRSYGELQYVHDVLGQALFFGPPGTVNEAEQSLAVGAGVILCWVLGHPAAQASDFDELVRKLEGKLVELGLLRAEDRRYAEPVP